MVVDHDHAARQRWVELEAERLVVVRDDERREHVALRIVDREPVADQGDDVGEPDADLLDRLADGGAVARQRELELGMRRRRCRHQRHHNGSADERDHTAGRGRHAGKLSTATPPTMDP